MPSLALIYSWEHLDVGSCKFCHLLAEFVDKTHLTLEVIYFQNLTDPEH